MCVWHVGGMKLEATTERGQAAYRGARLVGDIERTRAIGIVFTILRLVSMTKLQGRYGAISFGARLLYIQVLSHKQFLWSTFPHHSLGVCHAAGVEVL